MGAMCLFHGICCSVLGLCFRKILTMNSMGLMDQDKERFREYCNISEYSVWTSCSIVSATAESSIEAGVMNVMFVCTQIVGPQIQTSKKQNCFQ